MESRCRKRFRIPVLAIGTPCPSSTRIFIGSMPHSTSRSDIFHAFRHLGTILGISNIYKPRHATAYAFMEFQKAASAKRAVQGSSTICKEDCIKVAGVPVVVRHFNRQALRKCTTAVQQSPSKFTWRRAGLKSTTSSNAENAPPINISSPKMGGVKAVAVRMDDEADDDDDDDIELNIEEEFEQDLHEREPLSEGEVSHTSKASSNINSGMLHRARPDSTEATSSRLLTSNRYPLEDTSLHLLQPKSRTNETSPHLVEPERYWNRSPEMRSSSSDATEELINPYINATATKAIQTNEPQLKPTGLMWRPPSMTVLPPDCVLVFRQEDEISLVNSVHAELQSRGIRVEECLVKSTDNTTISAVLSHLGPTWEPLFAVVLQEHNYPERSITLVHFAQSSDPMQRGPTEVEYDLPINEAVCKVSCKVADIHGSVADRRRILRYATYTMALGVGLWDGDAERLSEEMLTIRGERIYRTLTNSSTVKGE